MKIGLYFGSFNPVHVGHLIIANYCATQTNLQKVWLVVSPQNPLKETSSLLNEYHRKHFLELAIDGNPNLKVSTVEFSLPKPSYTIDTLTYLTEKYPQHEFCVIMGADSFSNIKKWKNYATLIANYPIYVYQRPGFEIENTIGAQLTILEAPLLQISSTYIRQQIKNSKAITYLVPPAVEEQIINNGYYK
jgi:nicotinate-nucleotide adenylyltransferase